VFVRACDSDMVAHVETDAYRAASCGRMLPS